jgi:hypothetical protein
LHNHRFWQIEQDSVVPKSDKNFSSVFLCLYEYLLGTLKQESGERNGGGKNTEIP